MAYRTKIHSTTGFTPYELVFGRPMQTFKDWSSKEPIVDIEEAQQLLQRASEIKQLVERTHPEIQTKIQEKQDKQKKTQDTRNNVTTQLIAPGASVYIKSLKLQGKLQPKYHGPYLVKGRTNTGNYTLENNRGTTMRRAYTLSELKLVTPEAPDGSYVVEEIRDHRTRHGHLEYFVKWKDYPEHDCSWVKESSFDTTEIIEEYWNTINAPTEASLTTASIAKTHTLPNYVSCNWLMKIFIFLLFLPLIYTQEITGNYKLCDINNKVLVDTQLNCMQKLSSQQRQVQLWHVMSKRRHAIDGDAIVCKKSYITTSAVTGLVGTSHENTKEYPEHVTAEECKKMWETKRCDAYPMQCIDNSCTYYKEPVPKYKYMVPTHTTLPRCEITLKHVFHDDLNGTLAIGVSGPCKPYDFKCIFLSGIMIWTSSIIHTCPYQYMESGYFLQSHDFLYAVPTQNTTIAKNRTSASHLLFQLLEPVQSCNTTLYKTTEGLYITNASISNDEFDQVTDFSQIEHLTLADEDYNKFSLQELTASWQQMNQKRDCLMFQNYIKHLALDHRSKLISVHNLQAEEITLYTSNGNVYMPKCTNVKSFTLINKTENCYEAYPVIISTNTTTITAFLTDTGILVRSSAKIDCKDVVLESNIKNKYLFHMEKGHTTIMHLDSSNTYKMRIEETNLTNIDFHHDHLLDRDVFNDPEKSFSTVLDGDYGLKVTANDGIDNQLNTVDFFRKRFHGLGQWINDTKWTFLWAGLTILIGSIILVLLIIFCKHKITQAQIRTWINRTPRHTDNDTNMIPLQVVYTSSRNRNQNTSNNNTYNSN